MKLQLWSVGKAHDPDIKKAIDDFTSRLSNYLQVEWKILHPIKNAGNLSAETLKMKEGEMILEKLNTDDYLVVLDEKGKSINSQQLAAFLQQRANESTRRLIFLIGGAFGLSEPVIQRAKLKWSLSQLTFPHQLVRLILAEQLYRACTIIQNEKYHHS